MRRRAVAALVALTALTLAGTSTAGRDPGGGGALLPDIRTVVPQHLQIQNQQGHDYLRFSNGIANTGAGPWGMRPEPDLNTARALGLDRVTAVQELWDSNDFYRCGEQPKQVTACHNVVSEVSTGSFVFHPEHNHWHIEDVALFEVRKDDPVKGPIVGGNSIKTTFCLIDGYKVQDNSPTSERLFWDCYASYQGISAGWVDEYHQSTPGQLVDLTGVPDGDNYYLVSSSNFAGRFTESNYKNNTAWVRFRLYGDGKGNRKIEITGNSPCTLGTGLCGENSTNR